MEVARKRHPRLKRGQVVRGYTIVGLPKKQGHGYVWLVRHGCGARRYARADALHKGAVLCACRDKIKPISSVDAAWLAAAIDGEGTICFNVSVRKASSVGLALKLKPNLAVSNTIRVYCERALRAAGCGSISKAKPLRQFKAKGHGRGEYFSWDLSTWSQVEGVLTAIIPHLVIKQAKARAMLACCKRRRALHRNGSLRLTHKAMCRFARYVYERCLARFQRDGKAIHTCRQFLAIKDRRV